MNNAVGPSFKVNFDKFYTCESCKQYKGPTEMKRKRAMPSLKRYPNSHLM